jgi:hypothetical protein
MKVNIFIQKLLVADLSTNQKVEDFIYGNQEELSAFLDFYIKEKSEGRNPEEYFTTLLNSVIYAEYLDNQLEILKTASLILYLGDFRNKNEIVYDEDSESEWTADLSNVRNIMDLEFKSIKKEFQKNY